jgi:hypothetical protein
METLLKEDGGETVGRRYGDGCRNWRLRREMRVARGKKGRGDMVSNRCGGERRERGENATYRPQRSPKAVIETDIEERTPMLPKYCERRWLI